MDEMEFLLCTTVIIRILEYNARHLNETDVEHRFESFGTCQENNYVKNEAKQQQIFRRSTPDAGTEIV